MWWIFMNITLPNNYTQINYNSMTSFFEEEEIDVGDKAKANQDRAQAVDWQTRLSTADLHLSIGVAR